MTIMNVTEIIPNTVTLELFIDTSRQTLIPR